MIETGPVSGFEDVRRELRNGNRVLLLVRHAERPHIDHEDPSFGAALPLTENGRRMCVTFGEALQGASADVQFRASPLLRTMMTAREIARGLGVADPAIVEDEAIGNGSAFIADVTAVWQLFRDRLFFKHMGEYLANGVQTGFAPLASASAEYERYALSRFTGQLGIFATHDLYIAAYLAGKGLKRDWNADNWPRFLDAVMLVVEPSGAYRASLFRAGLSDRAIGVD